MGGVVVSPNIKRESVRIDPAGNVINPRTKAIVTPVEVEVEVSPVKVEPVVETAPAPMNSPLAIQQQIEDAKANLAQLEELKKLKIAEMKAQLELLQS